MRSLKITFDEPKRLANIDKHGFDFLGIKADFFYHAVFQPSHSGRMLATGFVGGLTLSIVFRPLGAEAVSIISMRRASPSERRYHERRQDR